MQHPLIEQFTGNGDDNNNQLNSDVYYENDTHLRVLGLTENKARVLFDVFNDLNHIEEGTTGKFANVGFEKNLVGLQALADELLVPALFVSKQPGNGAHYVAGVYFNDTLLLFNPIGLTRQADFYKQLAKIQQEYGTDEEPFNIILNDVKYQDEPTLYNCGPWSLEFVRHLMSLPDIDELLSAFVKQNMRLEKAKMNNGLTYYSADFNALLPMSLKDISADQYQPAMSAIRQEHHAVLGSYHMPADLSMPVKTHLTRTFTDTDTHVLVNELGMADKALDDIEDREELIRLEEEFDMDGRDHYNLAPESESESSTEEDPQVVPISAVEPTPLAPAKEDYKPAIQAVQNAMLRLLLTSRLNRADKKDHLDEYVEQAQKTIQRFCKFVIAMRVLATIFTACIFAVAYVAHAKRINADNYKPFNVKALADRYTKQFRGTDESLTASLLHNADRPVAPVK